MKAAKMLEMLNLGKIEELKDELRHEVYQEFLKDRPDEKKRYSAMKKYFSYINSSRKALQKPYIVDYEGTLYTSFCNSYSLVLTTEPPGAIALFDSVDDGNYPDVTRLINCNGDKSEIDISKVLAEAKSKGYRLKKSEVTGNHYVMHYNNSYFRMGLIDISYSIINNGKPVTVYNEENRRNSPITVVNDLGYMLVMPVRIEELDDSLVVIEAREKHATL